MLFGTGRIGKPARVLINLTRREDEGRGPMKMFRLAAAAAFLMLSSAIVCARTDDSAGQHQERGRSRKTKHLHRTSPLIFPAGQIYQHPRRLAYSSRAEKH